jgi:PAS domain S-box-containing protein
MSALPRPARLYIAALALAAGALAAGAGARGGPPGGSDLALALVFGGMLTVAWLFPLPFSFKTHLYLDTGVLVAAILVLEPGLAVLVAGSGTVLAHLVRRDDAAQTVFNGAQAMLLTGAGASVLEAGGWRVERASFDDPALLWVVPAGVAMWVVTELAVAVMVGLQSGVPAWRLLAQGLARTDGVEALAQVGQVGLGVVAAVLAEAQPWTLALLVLPAGAVHGALASNVGLRRRAEEALRGSEAALAEAQRVAHLGSWEWDLVNGEHVWSDEVYRLFGVEPRSLVPSYESFLRFVHPVDRAAVDGTVHAALYEGKPFAVEHRIRWEDGQERIVHQRGEAIFEQGRKVRVVGTMLDVTERKRLEQARDDLLASVSHDLKNPLTVIQGQAQLMRLRLRRSGDANPPWLVDGLTSINDAVSGITAQIDELVDVAKLQMGHALELRRDAVDLVALARARAATYQQTTTRHALQVEAAVPELVGEWDRRRLERVVDNLLGNAIKYSPAGGEIRIRVGCEDRHRTRWAVLAVADQGIGIPPADVPHVGERHRRGANVERIPGSGIGLAGARQIVAQHGGSIRVASEEGRGSVFTVSLPLAG